MIYETGAYIWRNLINGKVYVGGAYKSFSVRRESHVRALRCGRHRNKHFQAAWDKYGEDAFAFGILERCCPDEVEQCEQRWLDKIDPCNSGFGYNKSPTAGSSLGYRHTDETKVRMAAINRGKKQSPETIAKLAESRRGKKRSEETKTRMRIAQQNLSPEARMKRNAAISTAKLGKKLSIEHCNRLSESHKGIRLTEEHKAKLAEIHIKLGHKPPAQYGEKNIKTKLTVAEVKSIKVRIRDGWNNAQISREIGKITPEAVGLIRKGKTWRQVEI